MASLGSLVIELAANTARMQSDLGRAVGIAQTAAGRMTAAFRTVSSVLGAGGLSLTASAVFKKFVDNSSEAQSSMVRLEGAVRRAGIASNVTLAQIDALAGGLQSATRFSDEAIKDAASNLLRFDKVTGDTFTRALKISTDLAEVMGTSVPEAAASLGKALQLPGEGLRVLVAAGIKFNDEQIKTLQYMTETGRAVEAQNIILDELAKRTNGAAAEGVKTLGDAFAQLGNQLGEAAEAPGIIAALASGVSSLAENISKGMPVVKAGLSDMASYAKTAAEQALKLAKIVADPIGAIRGTGLFAPKEPEQRRSRTNRTGAAAARGFNGDPLAAETARRLAAEAAAEAAKKAAEAQRRSLANIGFDVEEMNRDVADAVSHSLDKTWEEQEKSAQEQSSFYEQLRERAAQADAESSERIAQYMDDATLRARAAAESMQSYFADFLFDPFNDGLKGMLKGFVDTVRRIVAEGAALKIFGKAGSGGLGDKITAGLGKGLKSLLGFADGGSFQVGGSGGTDSQLVAFRASPNETVSITKPGQGGGVPVFNIVNNFDMRGATMELAKVLPSILDAHSRRTIDLARAAVRDDLSRGAYG